MFGGLAQNWLSEYVNKRMKIRGLSKENYIGKLFKELFWKGVQQFTSEDVQWTVLESCPTIHSEDCPTYLFGELSNRILSKIEQCVFKNKKPFVLKTVLHTWCKHV